MQPKKGFVVWFTGLSGSGKTTNADILKDKLIKDGYNNIERLDGDIIRQIFKNNLGFTKDERIRNIERVTFLAKLLSRNKVGVLASFITPYSEMRTFIKKNVTNYIEVYVNAPLEVCELRDIKGLYKKARTGEIQDFTGISDNYDIPKNPDIIIETHKYKPEKTVNQIYDYLKENLYL